MDTKLLHKLVAMVNKIDCNNCDLTVFYDAGCTRCITTRTFRVIGDHFESNFDCEFDETSTCKYPDNEDCVACMVNQLISATKGIVVTNERSYFNG